MHKASNDIPGESSNIDRGLGSRCLESRAEGTGCDSHEWTLDWGSSGLNPGPRLIHLMIIQARLSFPYFHAAPADIQCCISRMSPGKMIHIRTLHKYSIRYSSKILDMNVNAVQDVLKDCRSTI